MTNLISGKALPQQYLLTLKLKHFPFHKLLFITVQKSTIHAIKCDVITTYLANKEDQYGRKTVGYKLGQNDDKTTKNHHRFLLRQNMIWQVYLFTRIQKQC